MIDGIRIYFDDKKSFENEMLKSGLFDFSSKYSVTTGEINEYPKTSEWRGMKVYVSEKTGFITGSLHKFYNNICTNKNQNYNDFIRLQLNSAVSKLQETFTHSELKKSHITMLEMGFNLKIPVNAKELISYRVLMYNFNPHNIIDPYKNKGYIKEFRIGDYRWKIYDKSLQYQLDYPLIRIELKITNKRVLQRFKILHTNDLLIKENLIALFDFFINKFENLVIVDNTDGKLLSQADKNHLNLITNNSYWSRFNEKNVSNRIIRNRKKTAIDFINDKGLNLTHNYLKKQLVLKFNELIELN